MGILQEGQKEYSFGKKVIYLAQKGKKKKKTKQNKKKASGMTIRFPKEKWGVLKCCLSKVIGFPKSEWVVYG